MAKELSIKSTVTISKKYGKDHKIILPIDPERLKAFNEGESIEVTEEELKSIGEHRWLEVK